jgi:proteasome lid subunit RPN8/RPN11
MCRRGLWATIVTDLRNRGGGQRESGGFLLGRREGDTRIIDGFIAYDEIDPNALRGHIEFDGSRMDVVWSECRRRGLQVVADVHTHPGGAGQSSVDQANPMIPERGHLALIIPNFARKLYLPGEVGIYEFRGREGWIDHSGQGSRFFAVSRFA